MGHLLKESYIRYFIKCVDHEVQKYKKLQAEQTCRDIHDVNLPLYFLAMKIANLSGNISDAEFRETIIDVEFHEGVTNLVSYDLSQMDLDRLIEAIGKSI